MPSITHSRRGQHFFDVDFQIFNRVVIGRGLDELGRLRIVDPMEVNSRSHPLGEAHEEDIF